jgi:hypothetical protein
MILKRLFFFMGALVCLLPLATAEVELIGKQGAVLKSDDWQLAHSASLATSFNYFGNTLDLNQSQHADQQAYLGYLLSLDLDLKHNNQELYLRVDSDGPFRSAAPLVPATTIQSLSGFIEHYNGIELLPSVRELWLKTPVSRIPLEVQIGRMFYTVGHHMALGGYYENWGVTTRTTAWKKAEFRFHYHKPDLENNWGFWRMGPHIRQEKAVGFDDNSRAHFFSTDATFLYNTHKIQPYIGFLVDRTGAARRNSIFATPVDQELLGTLGVDFNFEFGDWTVGFEAARNFGKAKSLNPDEFPDVKHEGFFFLIESAYHLFQKKVTPRSQLFVVSGNRYSASDLESGTIVKDHNRSYSVYSPLNQNLFDTHYPDMWGPLVFSSGGDALQDGILRNSTFRDPFHYDNLIMPNVGFDWQPHPRFNLGLDWWFMRAFAAGIGTQNGAVITLPKFLGHELDVSGEFQINSHWKANAIAGLFFPGTYYKTPRDDGDPLLVNSSPRYDGNADPAWQVELGFTFTY